MDTYTKHAKTNRAAHVTKDEVEQWEDTCARDQHLTKQKLNNWLRSIRGRDL